MSPNPAWLRRPSAGPGIDWDFVAYWILTVTFIGIGLQVLWISGPRAGRPVDDLFLDASLYFRATEAWAQGANPWAVRLPSGVPFAGPPPTLLLNLPLLPFGEWIVRPFWAVAGLAGWLFTMRRLHLAPWWILFPPFVEGWFAGSPDPALVGLMVAGGGAIAALTKPYSIPAMVADGHWRALLLAFLIGLATIPLLPWGLFFTQLETIQEAFATYSRHVSAWGDPVAMAVVAVALLLLGPVLGLRLLVPALWPGAQLHYTTFSARAGADSSFLALALSVPGFAAPGVVLFAIWVRLRERILRLMGRQTADDSSIRPETPTPRAPDGDRRPAHPELSIVVPVFKEGEAVAPVLQALTTGVNTPHEILVVYDFDEDPTVPVIDCLHADLPDIRGLRNDLGRGVLNAMKAGIAASRGDYVLISMADGSDEPHIVDSMVALAREGADVVAASRYMRGGRQVGGPPLKRLMSRTAGVTLHWFAGVPTHDPTNNFKLYSRRLLDATPIESEAGFELALELTVKATLAGRRVAEVPTTWRDRTAGQSNFKLRKWLPHYLRWYWLAMRGRFRRRYRAGAA